MQACRPKYSFFLVAWVGHIGLRLCDLIVHRWRPVGGAPPCWMANAGRCDYKKKKKKKTAYYTQIQQIARQDPVYYALLAATSEVMWQILYPYYMKATLPRDGIAFQHINLNVKRFIECGRGERSIQSPFTLNHKTDINCTLAIPGFRKHIRNCWNDAIVRESTAKTMEEHNSNCLKTRQVYLLADKKKYRDFVPAVCGPWDIELSRPEIIHGSNFNKAERAETARWVMNPWFVAIQPDHETLGVPEFGTWSTLSPAYRDLESLDATPSGQTNSHGRPMERFVASGPLRHVSHLFDALIGQARWDDPAVELEAGIVLGNDDAAAWDFVNTYRYKMKRMYKHNITIIRDVEIPRYGKDSYFRLVENGLFVTPKFEDDYSGQAPLSDAEDDGATDDSETSGREDNNESGTNGVESGTDGLNHMWRRATNRI